MTVNETCFHYLIIAFRQLLATNITCDTVNWIEGIKPHDHVGIPESEHPPPIHRMVEIFQNRGKGVSPSKYGLKNI